MHDAVICTDQTVPDCLSGDSHAHRKIQNAHRGSRFRVG